MAYVSILLVFSIFLSLPGNSENVKSKPISMETYDVLITNAMETYRLKKHKETVTLIHKAIADYQYVQEISAQCWIKCQEELTKAKMSYLSILDGQLNFLHYSIKMKACSDMCNKKFLGERNAISSDMKKFFANKEPYKYMQYSYSQLSEWDKALKAAYTYLEAHPDNENMRKNVGNFMRKANREPDNLFSLEEYPHITLYRAGEEAYFARNYTQCIELFEDSSLLFFKEVKKCISLCEAELETDRMFHSESLFDHYRELITCRQSCRNSLATGKTDTPAQKLVPLYYDFLQFCYFQEKRIHEAAECTFTYLYLVPDDEKMKNNLKYYRSQPGVKNKKLKPRKNAVKFYRQLSLESSLIMIAKGLMKPHEKNDEHALQEIENVHESVLKEISDLSGPARGDDEPWEIVDSRVPKYSVHSTSRAYRDQGRWKRHPEVNHSVLLMEEKELNGTDRVAFDNVIDEDTCITLMELVKKLAVGGDGYHHSHDDALHPFTEKEIFEGVTVGGAVDAVKTGTASIDEVELYFNVSEKMRMLTQEYFTLDKLNVAFTHLVCRHAIPEAITREEHISHPVHSDNCVVDGDGVGTCPKRSPAYTWRDYSALLYLNDNFTGGDFIFANYKRQIQARVKPTCGRMVAFQSKGIENLHGVLGVKSGTRCALPIWFTLSNTSEDKRNFHERTLKALKKRGDTIVGKTSKEEL